MDARIERDRERLLHQHSIGDEHSFVLAGNGEGAQSLFARSVFWNRVVGKGVLDVVEDVSVVAEGQGLGRIVTQIPNEAVVSHVFGKRCDGAKPILRDVFRSGVGSRGHTCKSPHEFSLRIVNFKRYDAGWNGFQVVIEDCAVRRIFSSGRLWRQRGFLVVVPANANRVGWPQ